MDFDREEMNKKVEQSRKDGYLVIRVEDEPFPLGALVKMVQCVYPGLSLDQIYIVEADEGDFILSIEQGAPTKRN